MLIVGAVESFVFIYIDNRYLEGILFHTFLLSKFARISILFF